MCSFNVIGDKLSWNVGDGCSIGVGEDSWVGNGKYHILHYHIILQHGLQGIFTLNQFDVRQNLPFSKLRWMSLEHLGFRDDEDFVWKVFSNKLALSHVCLYVRDDKLVWVYDPHGSYSLKKGYELIMGVDEATNLVWWWCSLWKLNFLGKTKLLMWFFLRNIVVTWDRMQRIN